MFLSSLLASRRRRPNRRTRQSDTPARRSLLARRLRVESLEDRQLLSAVSGQVFNDLNADGVESTGEAGQSGWTIYLDANTNGQLDPGETSTTTLADGSYTFNGLAAGSYNVAEVLQLGWRQTAPTGTAPAIERVSVASDGTQGNSSSVAPSPSADGRYVAFNTSASNLVPGDTNGLNDIFVHDRQTDTTERVSVAADGTQANGASTGAKISVDGRYVAFSSDATNLVPGDTNGATDIFVYDRQTHAIERVSVAADGTQANDGSNETSLSADGRYVAFTSSASNLVPGDTNGVGDIFVYDRQTDTTERVSVAADGTQANGGSGNPSISGDGRCASFASVASNLVPGDTNGITDIFVYDRQTHTTERVSAADDGTQANSYSGFPSMSADGRYIAFNSNASNLVPGDTNGWTDDFVYDRQTHTIERVNVASDGTQANGLSGTCSLGADGRYVAFSSAANNLVPGDANGWMDTFVHDRQTHTTKLASLAADGTQTSGGSSSGSTISADARFVAFCSTAGNLVPGDTNGSPDVFITTTPFTWTPGSRAVSLAEGQTLSGIDFANAAPTKFYVVNDASQDRTSEYTAAGQLNELYGLNSGNTAPRGAATTIAGDKTWVVDANRKVYVYNNSGALLGSWTAGTLASNAKVEGIATNGTDVWIVDARTDKVYKYTGAATRLSGSQNAASSFSLNVANTNPKDIVTDGTNLWVVDDSTTDKVFKYTTAGTLVFNWSIVTPGVTSPTGITIDPANPCDVWIVDSGTNRVYQYIQGALTIAVYSRSAAMSFPLAPGITNPQGIADPPGPGSVVAIPRSTSALAAADAAILSLGNNPIKADNVLSPVSAKPTAEFNVSRPTASYRPTPAALADAAATKPAAKLAANRGPAVRAVDHLLTSLADELNGELSVRSLAHSRA